MNYENRLMRIKLLRLSQQRLFIPNQNICLEKNKKRIYFLLKIILLIIFITILILLIININYFFFLTKPYGFEKDIYPKMEILFNKNYSRINTVLKYSKLHNFPPLLTTAIIYAESSNNVYCLSHVQARGLMQVREVTGIDTALMYAKKPILAKVIQIIPDILYYPELNIYISTLYIKTFKEHYKWNWQEALHAYNVGPNAFLGGKRHYYYVNRIMKFYSNWTKLSAKEIKKVYFNDLYAIFGKKLAYF